MSIIIEQLGLASISFSTVSRSQVTDKLGKHEKEVHTDTPEHFAFGTCSSSRYIQYSGALPSCFANRRSSRTHQLPS